MNMTVDVTPIIVAAITSLVPIVLGFLANVIWKQIKPEAVRYLGEKNAAIFQERVDHVLNAGIGYAVQQGVAAVTARGGITLDTRNLMVDMAVKYAAKHAPDLMAEAGDVVEKVLARFDTHPAVQGLIVATTPAGAPA